MTILATDNFDRGNNSDLGTAWDPCPVETNPNGLKIDSNDAKCSNTASDASETYNAVAFPADQYSEVVIGGVDGNGAGKGCGPTCRQAAGSVKTYYRFIASLGGWQIGKKVAGSYTSLGSAGSPTFTTGDKAKVALLGTTWFIQKNGETLAGGSGTDSSIASGRPGISYSSTENFEVGLQSWEGGDLVPAAAIGFNFRATSGFVADGANQVCVLDIGGGLGDSYPTLRGGVIFGWEDVLSNTRDRSSSVDARFAGVHFTANNGTDGNKRFRFDLSQAGRHKVNVALGDIQNNQIITANIKDNTTLLTDLTNGGAGFSTTTTGTDSEFVDASAVKRTSMADWIAHAADAPMLTFDSKILRVTMNPANTAFGQSNPIAHISVERDASQDGTRTLVAGPYPFNGTSGLVASTDPTNWTEQNTYYAHLDLAANAFQCSGGAVADCRWNGAGSFTDNQYFEVKLAGMTPGSTNDAIGGNLRNNGGVISSSSTFSAYRVLWYCTAAAARVYKVVNGDGIEGLGTQLGADIPLAMAVGDTLSAEAITNGANVDIRVLANGVWVATRSDTSSVFTGGKPGIAARISAGIAGDDWTAGNVTVGGAPYPNIHKTYGWARF